MRDRPNVTSDHIYSRINMYLYPCISVRGGTGLLPWKSSVGEAIDRIYHNIIIHN